jgi:hypothetical protein
MKTRLRLQKTLANAQEKLKGNTVLWRQVKNLSKQNWSLIKTLRVLRLQVRSRAGVRQLHFVLFDHGMESFSAHIMFPSSKKKSDVTPAR